MEKKDRDPEERRRFMRLAVSLCILAAAVLLLLLAR